MLSASRSVLTATLLMLLPQLMLLLHSAQSKRFIDKKTEALLRSFCCFFGVLFYNGDIENSEECGDNVYGFDRFFVEIDSQFSDYI